MGNSFWKYQYCIQSPNLSILVIFLFYVLYLHCFLNCTFTRFSESTSLFVDAYWNILFSHLVLSIFLCDQTKPVVCIDFVHINLFNVWTPINYFLITYLIFLTFFNLDIPDSRLKKSMSMAFNLLLALDVRKLRNFYRFNNTSININCCFHLNIFDDIMEFRHWIALPTRVIPLFMSFSVFPSFLRTYIFYSS